MSFVGDPVAGSETTDRRPELAGHAFVGRTAELELLDGVLAEARRGRPRFVVVAGPEGIGKTALAERFAALAGERQVLRATGARAEAGLTYAILDQLLAGGGERTLPRTPDVPAAGAALLKEIAGRERTGPVIVIIDDVRWSDHASLDAICYALRRRRETRLAVMMIVRDLADARIPDETRRLFEAGGTTRVRLAGLDEAAVAELCERVKGRRPSARAAARLRRHTLGNPMHLRSLLGQVSAERLEELDLPLPAPHSLTVRVLAGLARCGRDGASLTAAAAVLGDRSPLHLAAKVAGVDDPLAALDEAIDAGLLAEEFGTGHVLFPCPLTRAAVYQEYLSPSRRAELHRRAAALAPDAETALWHRGRGAAGPDAGLAKALAELGRSRSAAGEWAEAARHLGAAARLAPHRADRERFALEAAEGRIIMGDADPSRVADQVSGLRASPWRTYVLGTLSLNAGRVDEAEAMLGEAWRHAETSDAALAAKVAGQLALLRAVRADGRGAVEWSDRARRTAPAALTVDALASARAHGLALTGPAGHGSADRSSAGHGSAGRDSAGHGLAGHDSAGRSSAERDSAGRDSAGHGCSPMALPDPGSASVADLDALAGRGRLRLALGDIPGAVRDLDGVLAAGPRLSVRVRLLACLARAEADHRRGAWDEILGHCAAAVRLAEDADHLLLTPLCHAVAALVHAARGDAQTAAACLRAARASGPLTENTLARGYVAAAAMHLAAVRGDHEAVIAGPRPDHHLLAWEHLLVDALTATGRLDEAESLLGPLERRATDPGRQAAVARARGNLLAARRRPDDAFAAFERALESPGGTLMPFETALTELDYGSYMRRLGKRAKAAQRLEHAHAAFESLGARPYLERCGRELAACGRLGRGRPAAERAHDALTARELAVAKHAARGLTNRQIARELVVSVKTVEYHLSHIYPKLRVRSRTQLAVRLGGH
ncbi:AAA family ATPase [Thermopolyspora sp. NPDC052614]|uniref:helix-turn-helix transcriptional regulator n=1 Tax=Thermopolyspora sp. NPDC052614 TaxID=3155682 RepID=UPI003445FF92